MHVFKAFSELKETRLVPLLYDFTKFWRLSFDILSINMLYLIKFYSNEYLLVSSPRILKHLTTSDDKSYLDPWSRKDARKIESAIRAMWPKEPDLLPCASLTIEECADIAISKITPEFTEKFGSDYQSGVTREHYLQLFWLAIPRIVGSKGEPILPAELKLSERTFTCAMAALYRPKYKVDGLTVLSSWQRGYRWAMRKRETNVTIHYRDPSYAKFAIPTLFNALHNTKQTLPYYGAMSKTERDELRQKIAPKGIGSHFLWFAESLHDGQRPWGVNIRVTLPYAIAYTRDGCKQDVYLLLNDPIDCIFWFGGYTKPSENLSIVNEAIANMISQQVFSVKSGLDLEEAEAKIKAQAKVEAQAWKEGLCQATPFSDELIREVMEYDDFAHRLMYRS